MLGLCPPAGDSGPTSCSVARQIKCNLANNVVWQFKYEINVVATLAFNRNRFPFGLFESVGINEDIVNIRIEVSCVVPTLGCFLEHPESAGKHVRDFAGFVALKGNPGFPVIAYE